MYPLFEQLGFVCSVLAGFAFAFVASLLTVDSTSRAYSWVFGSALFAAIALTVAAVGSVFAGLGAGGKYLDENRVQDMLEIISPALQRFIQIPVRMLCKALYPVPDIQTFVVTPYVVVAADG